MKRTYKSRVVKFSGEKTIKVVVLTTYAHKIYKKIIKRQRNFLVHNNSLDLKIGDWVLIKECRPISKLKHFYVERILNGNDDTKANISQS